MLACQQGEISLVRELLEAGIDCNATDNVRHQPEHFCLLRTIERKKNKDSFGFKKKHTTFSSCSKTFRIEFQVMVRVKKNALCQVEIFSPLPVFTPEGTDYRFALRPSVRSNLD